MVAALKVNVVREIADRRGPRAYAYGVTLIKSFCLVKFVAAAALTLRRARKLTASLERNVIISGASGSSSKEMRGFTQNACGGLLRREMMSHDRAEAIGHYSSAAAANKTDQWRNVSPA